MKHLYLIMMASLLWGLGGIATAQAQNQRITGRTTDENGSPLPGVNVLIKGTTVGTTSDVDGRYSLSIAQPNATLVFSFIGFEPQEVAVGSQSVINVTMKVDVKSLEEVVVVGYGTQKKSDLTGSVASVTSKEIKQVAVASLDQALQGRAAGVQVTQASAAPGG
ncbi:MAG: carboxypeptidase-like regulatory domain-containing protein, partial [Bernardetiaceae bacterium]|nr:carboxypeptidase-like regulatory domain-containing protein [Bernardetiaceae bacterium]